MSILFFAAANGGHGQLWILPVWTAEYIGKISKQEKNGERFNKVVKKG